MRKETLSVVVPVFNAAQNLTLIVEKLGVILPGLASRFELILVDDGSRDESWKAVESLADRFSWIRGIHLMRNYGQHNALLCGIREAVFDIVVTMDDDLQNPPEEIPKLLEKIREGYDVVYGTPLKEQHGLFWNPASRMTKLSLQNAMGAETASKVSAFRAFRCSIRDAFVSYNGPFVSIDVLLTWGTTRFASIPVRHDPRRLGISNYTLSKLILHALNMMTGFTVLPLQFAYMIGFLFTLFGFGVLARVLGRYIIQGTSVPGFPFLASTIVIFSGAQLFVLGIIGEYFARMHFRMMDKPAYTVRERRISKKGPKPHDAIQTRCVRNPFLGFRIFWFSYRPGDRKYTSSGPDEGDRFLVPGKVGGLPVFPFEGRRSYDDTDG